MTRIVGVQADPSGTAIRLEFGDGFTGTVDLRPLVRPACATAALGDPRVFAAVRIGGGGRFLEWPGEIELCADALRQRARSE